MILYGRMTIRLWDSRANLIPTLPTRLNPSNRAPSNKAPSMALSIVSNRAPSMAPIPRAPIPRASTSSMAGLTMVRFSGMNKVMDIMNIVITLFLINVVIYITPLNMRSMISTVMYAAINMVTFNTATLNTSNPIYPVVMVS